MNEPEQKPASHGCAADVIEALAQALAQLIRSSVPRPAASYETTQR